MRPYLSLSALLWLPMIVTSLEGEAISEVVEAIEAIDVLCGDEVAEYFFVFS